MHSKELAQSWTQHRAVKSTARLLATDLGSSYASASAPRTTPIAPYTSAAKSSTKKLSPVSAKAKAQYSSVSAKAKPKVKPIGLKAAVHDALGKEANAIKTAIHEEAERNTGPYTAAPAAAVPSHPFPMAPGPVILPPRVAHAA